MMTRLSLSGLLLYMLLALSTVVSLPQSQPLTEPAPFGSQSGCVPVPPEQLDRVVNGLGDDKPECVLVFAHFFPLFRFFFSVLIDLLKPQILSPRAI